MDLRTESDNIFFEKLDKLSSVIFFKNKKDVNKKNKERKAMNTGQAYYR
jgi:hypothetical protein